MTKAGVQETNLFEGSFRTLDEFVREYPLYPDHSVATYSLYRDICLNNDVDVTDIHDTGSEYVIKTFVRRSSKERIHFAVDVDSDVDLEWLHGWSTECERKGSELCMCLLSADAIIYQLVGNTLSIVDNPIGETKLATHRKDR